MQTSANTLIVKHTRDRHGSPLACLHNLPGDGAELGPSKLRAIAATLNRIADECGAGRGVDIAQVCSYEITATPGRPYHERRVDLPTRLLCQSWFDRVRRGNVSPREAADALDRAGVPFEVQCRLLSLPRATERETASADERLRAAAGDMLDALRICRGNVASLGPAGALEPYAAYIPWLQMLDAVIAKATGEHA